MIGFSVFIGAFVGLLLVVDAIGFIPTAIIGGGIAYAFAKISRGRSKYRSPERRGDFDGWMRERSHK